MKKEDYQARRAAGLCGWEGCPERSARDGAAAYCAHHLDHRRKLGRGYDNYQGHTHRCSTCRRPGHHAQACDENREAA